MNQVPNTRTPAARSEMSPDRRGMGWKLADVKVATRKRNKARKAAPGTVFTSDPQNCAPAYHYTGTTRA